MLSKIRDDCLKNVTTRVLIMFSADLARWPSFDPRWPSFKPDLKIIKTNILSKIYDYCLKNVTARVLTKFSADLARWPSFWLQVTQFRIWTRTHQDKYFEQDSWWLLDLIVLGFNDMSTLVGHFVSSPRQREKSDRRDSWCDERGTGEKEEQEWKWRNRRNKNIPPLP